MNKFLIPVLLALAVSSYAQDSSNKRTIIVNSMDEQSRVPLMEAVFLYPEFKQSKLVYKDNAVTEALLNYNRYFGQLYFINEKKDTMVLARPELFNMFVLDKDTFYFNDKTYAYLVTHYGEVNLVKNEALSLVGREKKGLYGSYSGVYSADSEKTFTYDEMQMTTWLKMDENAVYKMGAKYLLRDKYNNFFPAVKKNFYNLFSKNEKALKKYLQDNRVDLDKEADLLRLLEYANKL
jgi:hypothetical protein